MLAFASVSPRVAPAASSRAGARRPGAPAGAPSRLRVRVRATPTEEPTDEDFVLFNSMLASGDIPKAIRDAAVEGKLTPATLGAAYVVFDKCKSLEEDAPVLKTLESVITLITQTLQQLNATPAVRLIDELMTIDPTAEAEAVRATKKWEAAATDRASLAQELQAAREELEGMAELRKDMKAKLEALNIKTAAVDALKEKSKPKLRQDPFKKTDGGFILD